jgi:methionyl-tRNA formyltransferase
VRVGVAATPRVALPTLEWLISSEHELALVITQPDRPAGRGKGIRESVVGQWAQIHGVPLVKPELPMELLQSLDGLDLVITIGYGVILPAVLLSIPKFGFINLHFSLLPAWRGAAPVARAILNGDTTSGVTVFQLDAGMDTGPIFTSRQLSVDPTENAGELLERMAGVGPAVISETLELIAKRIAPLPQSAAGVSFAPKTHKEDSRIDWNTSAISIDRHIRAFTPDPGAWTLWRDQQLRVSRALITHAEVSLNPGEITDVDGHLLVGCESSQMIEVTELTPAGKKEMSATAWINGARIVSGDSFV